jgi:hypothetical protein
MLSQLNFLLLLLTEGWIICEDAPGEWSAQPPAMQEWADEEVTSTRGSFVV